MSRIFTTSFVQQADLAHVYAVFGTRSPNRHSNNQPRVVLLNETDIFNILFGQPPISSYPKPKPKERVHTRFSAPQAPQQQSREPQDAFTGFPFADIARSISNLFSNFFAPFFGSDAKADQGNEAQKVAPKQKSAACACDPLAFAPKEIREHASYKDNKAFKNVVSLHTQLSGKPEKDIDQSAAQKQLMKIFEVDSYAEAKKGYKALSKLIHPDRARLIGLKEDESQKFLTKLFAFINEYYTMAN